MNLRTRIDTALWNLYQLRNNVILNHVLGNHLQAAISILEHVLEDLDENQN